MTVHDDAAEAVEQQIRDLQREVDYQVREYPIEVVVQKYTTDIEADNNELFVPDYQRELVWPERQQSKFIESLLIGLPIPYVFVADVKDDADEERSGRLEIVDGTQRIRTLARFLSNELQLGGLEKLLLANGCRFKDLSLSRQRRFQRITIRMIELTEKTTEETRRDMFERINTGTLPLNPMERRRGSMVGPFIDLVARLAKNPRFKELAPVSAPSEKRFERDELVSRFFAFQDYGRYGNTDSGKRVADFVDDYSKKMNEKLNADGGLEAQLTRQWQAMLDFVADNFPNGFRKSASAKSTPRVRFESIAVGSSLALSSTEKPLHATVTRWIDSAEFKELTTSDAANNQKRVVERIEYVRDRLLEG